VGRGVRTWDGRKALYEIEDVVLCGQEMVTTRIIRMIARR
jgi:hypothetical protein